MHTLFSSILHWYTYMKWDSFLWPLCAKWLVYSFLYQVDFSVPLSGARDTCPLAPSATPLGFNRRTRSSINSKIYISLGFFQKHRSWTDSKAQREGLTESLNFLLLSCSFEVLITYCMEVIHKVTLTIDGWSCIGSQVPDFLLLFITWALFCTWNDTSKKNFS